MTLAHEQRDESSTIVNKLEYPMTKPALHARSLAAQAMGKIDPLTKAVVPPIHVATTYIRDEDSGYSSGFI